jgi:hypothetical protein
VNKLRAVHVGWWIGIALVAFVILYNTIPYNTFLGIALNTAFAASLAAFVRYFLDTIRALRSGAAGLSFMLTSMLSIFSMVLIQRSWAMSLDALDRPEWLVTSFMTILIPWMMAVSLSLATVAPDIESQRENSGLRIIGSILIFLLGMAAGVAFYSILPERVKGYAVLNVFPHLANRPTCPAGSVVVSSRRVYHLDSSPYIQTVVPRHCFDTAADAEAKGYRPAKGLK